jgi:biopolymer transport protein ExbB
MKPRHLILCALALQSAFAAPQTASMKPDEAIAHLTELKRQYDVLRGTEYREINKLDDQALQLGKELRELEREHERRIATERTLEREVALRKQDFDYSVGILNQYAKSFATRLHPAENQIYTGKIAGLEQKAISAANDPAAETNRRCDILALGIERLGTVGGGAIFPGKGLKNGSEAISGTFLLAGPAVYFTAENASFEGVSTYVDSGTELPTVVAIQDSGGRIRRTITDAAGPLPLDGSMGKALEVEAARDSIVDTIRKGGYVGYAILGLGAISLLIALFKALEVTGFPVPNRSTINAILDDLLAGRRAEALEKASEISGMCGELVTVGVQRFDDKRRVLEEALFEKMVIIKPRLDRLLPFLGLTAAAAPLMGLLGTVLGIIKTFQAMAIYGTGNAKSFSAGISEALITTAQGLIVAIPILVIHGILKSLVKAKYGDVEGIAIALVNGTSERRSEIQSSEGESAADDDDMALAPSAG